MIHVPVPPPEPVIGVPHPTYVAHDGYVWRRSVRTWELVDAHTAPRLLSAFQSDAKDKGDWWHRRAGELAIELEAAIAQSYHMESAA